MKEIWITIPASRVFGKEEGDGPLILGLHGWSQRNGWHTWQPLMAPLAAAGFRVISVDMPGWGQSPPLAGGPLGAERAVEVIVAMLDFLGAQEAILMGKSWGGGVALMTALNYAERIQKLMLTAPAFRHLEDLRKLVQPVLLAWAEDDRVIPISNARQYVVRVPNLEMVTYPSGGHSAAPKNAAAFASKAVQFLSQSFVTR